MPLKHVDYREAVPIFRTGPRYLFRGERDWYPDTYSSKDRLSRIRGFSEEEVFDFVDCASTIVSYLALRIFHRIPPQSTPEYQELINELRSWVQHYEVPVMSIDVSSDIEVAAFFASYGNTSGRGRLFVGETSRLIPGGNLLRMDEGYCPRARRQKAYAVRMWDDRPNLQAEGDYPLKKYDFVLADSDRKFADRMDLLSTKGDVLALHLADLLAKAEPQFPRVKALFDEIAGSLRAHMG